jgi:general secretion pathway protein G
MESRGSSGFTLIEIMVVVVIIGILGAMIVPRIMDRVPQARVTAAQNDLRAVANALEMYKMDNFHYPSTDQGLEALVTKPSGFPEAKNWSPSGYLPKTPIDPWTKPYVYIATENGFELFSLGADGVEGGEGYDADLHYEPK